MLNYIGKIIRVVLIPSKVCWIGNPITTKKTSVLAQVRGVYGYSCLLIMNYLVTMPPMVPTIHTYVFNIELPIWDVRKLYEFYSSLI